MVEAVELNGSEGLSPRQAADARIQVLAQQALDSVVKPGDSSRVPGDVLDLEGLPLPD